MTGYNGVITIAYDEKDAVCSLEHAYWAAAAENSYGKGDVVPFEAAPAKNKKLLPKGRPEARKPAGNTSGSMPTNGVPLPPA